MMADDLSIFDNKDLEELIAEGRKAMRMAMMTINPLPAFERPIARLLYIEELREKLDAYQTELKVRQKAGGTALGPPEVYDVFVSYAEADSVFAAALAAAMSSNGVSVFFAPVVIRVGESIVNRIDHALSTCRTGVVIWSHAADASKWVENERDTMLMRRNSGEMKVKLVRVEDHRVPTILSGLVHADALGTVDMFALAKSLVDE